MEYENKNITMMSVRIKKEIAQKFAVLARLDGTTQSDLVRNFIYDYIKNKNIIVEHEE